MNPNPMMRNNSTGRTCLQCEATSASGLSGVLACHSHEQLHCSCVANSSPRRAPLALNPQALTPAPSEVKKKKKKKKEKKEKKHKKGKREKLPKDGKQGKAGGLLFLVIWLKACLCNVYFDVRFEANMSFM